MRSATWKWSASTGAGGNRIGFPVGADLCRHSRQREFRSNRGCASRLDDLQGDVGRLEVVVLEVGAPPGHADSI
jgi:hypothetical protein